MNRGVEAEQSNLKETHVLIIDDRSIKHRAFPVIHATIMQSKDPVSSEDTVRVKRTQAGGASTTKLKAVGAGPTTSKSSTVLEKPFVTRSSLKPAKADPKPSRPLCEPRERQKGISTPNDSDESHVPPAASN